MEIKLLFKWFYCLDILEALLIVILATLLFYLLRKLFSDSPFWEPIIAFALVACLTAIVAVTITNRVSDPENSTTLLLPFYSYYAVLTGGNRELLRSNFMNVLLFYPAGVLACELLPKTWKRCWKLLLIVPVFMLLSTGIEVCQYHFALGQAEVDDVIHNTLGTLIGAMVSSIHISGRKLKSSD